MSFVIDKRTGPTWVRAGNNVQPESFVQNASPYSLPGTLQWSTGTPPVALVRVDNPQAPVADPQTGHYWPAKPNKVWDLSFDVPDLELGQLVQVTCEYHGPPGFHQSYEGCYRVDLELHTGKRPTGDLPRRWVDSFLRGNPTSVFGIAMYFDVVEVSGQNSRPYRISGANGKLVSVGATSNSPVVRAQFRFQGSFTPDRNVHLKPHPADELIEDRRPTPIEVLDVYTPAPVYRVGKRNLGIHKSG